MTHHLSTLLSFDSRSSARAVARIDPSDLKAAAMGTSSA
jgi:hypothetical protein